MSSPSTGSAGRPKVNLRSTAVKRIMQEASELSASDAQDDFIAAPLESDIFEWHVTMRGTAGSEYEGGLYHLRILLPPSYPMSAPDIIFMTPNGRFELGKKICIDGLTSFHAGSWQPAWGVRTAVLGLRSFWMQGGEALSAIGALDQPKEERKRLAKISHEWECPQCGKMKDQIPESASSAPANGIPFPEPTKRVPLSPNSADGAQPKSEVSSSLSHLPRDVSTSTGNFTPPPRPVDPETQTHTDIVPSPEDATSEVTRPVPTPTIAAPVPHQVRTQGIHRQAPVWIDAMIFLGIAVLVGLLYRKIGNSSNLVETVSL